MSFQQVFLKKRRKLLKKLLKKHKKIGWNEKKFYFCSVLIDK